ncbi:MAG: hypothetical protein M1827_002735 [Pycnora praestabilis]|nr:MAG: hypothetical protein M1827_002735 [Pycnora praestabilis]
MRPPSAPLALLTTTLIYPALTYLNLPLFTTHKHSQSVPQSQLPLRLRAISTLHSTLVTLLSLYILRKHTARLDQSNHNDPRDYGWEGRKPAGGSVMIEEGGGNPLLEARDGWANALTAAELGYLIQDIVMMLFAEPCFAASPLPSRPVELTPSVSGGAGVGRQGRRRLDKVMLAHHLGIGGALGVLQWYIARGRDRGVVIIVGFLLMNAS